MRAKHICLTCFETFCILVGHAITDSLGLNSAGDPTAAFANLIMVGRLAKSLPHFRWQWELITKVIDKEVPNGDMKSLCRMKLRHIPNTDAVRFYYGWQVGGKSQT